MSLWDELKIGKKIIQILEEVKMGDHAHHLGRPFLTAYQIAIKFAEKYPEDVNRLNLPVGGAGTGQHRNLAQYIARELSQQIKKDGQIMSIDGGFLSNDGIEELKFKFNNDETIQSSLKGNESALSLFRLK